MVTKMDKNVTIRARQQPQRVQGLDHTIVSLVAEAGGEPPRLSGRSQGTSRQRIGNCDDL